MQNHPEFSYPKLRYLAEVILLFAVIPGAFLGESSWGQRLRAEQVNLPFFIDGKPRTSLSRRYAWDACHVDPQLSEKSFIPFSGLKSSSFVMFLLLYGPSSAEEGNGSG